MINAEVISHKIGDYLKKELLLDNKRKSIIVYGLFSIIQIGISLLLTIILGIATNTLQEALIITFVIVMLRKYTGGAHAETPNKCLITGLIVTIIPAFIINRLVYLGSLKLVIISTIIIYLVAFVLILKNAPVDNKNKRIKSDKKRKRLKKSSIVILIMYIISSTILGVLFLRYGNVDMLKYISSISYGVLWQVFTLTNFSAKII
ncbi:accessory gene regulator ArgB-like protein [Clostridium sp.]|uniref:accessory gene regulator ArgB-like protein n=1 Tax=Clostridium sp. TaxID=1506 RepID=UPI002FCB9A76